MKDDDVFRFRQTISYVEFICKLSLLLWRIPYIAYQLITGIKTILGNKKISWGLMLENIAQKYPENVAVKSLDGILTYRELNERANQCAHFLISRGIVKGDTVTVCLENRPELLIVYCGCAKIGAVCSLINTNQRGDSLVYSFNLNKGSIIIIGEECSDFFREVRKNIEIWESEVLFLRDPKINRIGKEDGDITDDLMTMPSTNITATRDITLEDKIAYVYTSGTSGGMPKAAVINNKRTFSAMFWFGRIVTRIRPGHTVYVPLPFFHTNALACGWPAALYNGAAVAIRRKFSAGGFIDDVRKFNVTHFIYIGEVCRYLMAKPAVREENRTTLKYIMGNGLRPDIWLSFKRRFGIKKVFEFYGAAEGVGVFTNIFNFDFSVGTSLTPYAIVRYDVENDAAQRNDRGFLTKVKKGESGLLIMEISAKTPFAGYSDKKKTEEKIIRDAFKKGDRWFNTGDMLRNMGFRHAQFVDRLGDTFRWKGENVATMEVERAINSFPGVYTSAVYGIGIPGSDGKAGMAAIIKAEGRTIDFAGFTAHLKSILPRYAVPLFLRFVDDFQWTATHKIKKTELKNESYDPVKVKGMIYVLKPGSESYVPMDDSTYRDIISGKYLF